MYENIYFCKIFMFRCDELINGMLLPTLKVTAASTQSRVVLEAIKLKNNKVDLHIYKYYVNLNEK
jgi:hypothetical protein